jgi:hypothetical protein
MNRWKQGKRILLLSVIFLLAFTAFLLGCKGPAGPAGPKGETGPAGPEGSSTGTISGKITDAAGAAIEGATVVTLPATSSVTTDASGNYEITDVPIGIYTVKASKSGYNANSQSNVSVAADQTATVNLTLATAAPFALAKVRGVTPWDEEVYPDSKVWITLQGGYAYHDNEKIITAGLNSVGVGSYVYLQGASKDGAGKEVSSWSWELIDKPMQSTAALENAATQYPRLLTDKPGTYTIKLTVTNVDGETSSSSLKVYAGSYVGAEVCASCHSGSVMPDVVTSWQETGHATKLEDFYFMYSEERDYCIGCHSTGYNEADSAAGFDDLAKQAGWDPATGSLVKWLKDNNWTVEDIKASPMGKLINIQCEACHGPGSVHTKAKSFEAGVCLQCHYPGPDQYGWLFSKHATGERVGTNYLHAAESASCAACHTAQGFVVQTIEGKAGIYPDEATAQETATLPAPGEMSAITCVACHDPHQATNPTTGGYGGTMKSYQLRTWGEVTLPVGVSVDAEESAICVTCHNGKRDADYLAAFIAGNKNRAVHANSQAPVFYGVNELAVTYGKTFESSRHTTVVEEGCVQCHMAPQPVTGPGDDGVYGTRDDEKEWSVGGHSWNMSSETPFTVNGTEYTDNVGWWITQDDTEVSLGGACNVEGCHKAAPLTSFDRPASADFDGDGTVEGVQTEIEGLLAKVAELLPKDDQGNVLSYPITAQNTSEAERKALWNYWLVANDGSKGIHNTKFVVLLLQETYYQLTGSTIGQPPPTPPDIVHLPAITDCTSCHDGVTAPFPADHAGRTNEICETCHARGTPPVAAPATHTPDLDCVMCHQWPNVGTIPFPEDHAGRTTAVCTSCHEVTGG